VCPGCRRAGRPDTPHSPCTRRVPYLLFWVLAGGASSRPRSRWLATLPAWLEPPFLQSHSCSHATHVLPPTQPLKQYLKALVTAAADGSAQTGEESGETTSSGGEGYTSGGLLDSSAPPPAFKPTSNQVADFQQRLKGVSAGAAPCCCGRLLTS
jgi:hypothetical protein